MDGSSTDSAGYRDLKRVTATAVRLLPNSVSETSRFRNKSMARCKAGGVPVSISPRISSARLGGLASLSTVGLRSMGVSFIDGVLTQPLIIKREKKMKKK